MWRQGVNRRSGTVMRSAIADTQKDAPCRDVFGVALICFMRIALGLLLLLLRLFLFRLLDKSGEQGMNELFGIEFLQVLHLLAQADELHREA